MPAITNAAVNKSAPGASISVNMPITVEGNLDKEVIPDIDKIADKVVNTITKTLTKKGYIRPANWQCRKEKYFISEFIYNGIPSSNLD